jgi:dephospho-CoA kinase
MILLVTGMPYSGKTTFADFCVKFGVPAVFMGKVVRHEVKEMGLSEENILSYARALRLMFGREVIARRTLEMVKQYEGDYSLVVVDGVRSMYEVNYFRRRLRGDTRILAILAG